MGARNARPVRVNGHDFPDMEAGKAVPYGIYDVAANAGWVNVGTDGDTAAFAVESIRRWWQARQARLPCRGQAADHRRRRRLQRIPTRAWKTGLAALAAETGLDITVCRFPPGTSKSNKIEHRLFSAISMNWRGRPLTSHEVIVETIAATTTAPGLPSARSSTPAPARPASRSATSSRPGWRSPATASTAWNYTLLPHAGRARGPRNRGQKPPADGTAPPWPTPR